jgi:hypothetical protein
MPSSFSPNLRIELIGDGEQAGTWGTTTNTNLGTLVEDAISGYVAVTISSANQALTAVNGAADQARNAMVQLNSASSAFSVYAPPESKQYVLFNNTAHAATIYNSTALGNTTAAGTGVTIPAGKTATVWSDGTNFSFQSTYIAPAIFTDIANLIYPVGSIYTNATNNTNPATLLGFGTWTAFGAGRVPVGFDAGNANFNSAEKTGGTQDAITVAHTHTFSGSTGGQSANHTHSGTTTTAGAHSHVLTNATGDVGGAAERWRIGGSTGTTTQYLVTTDSQGAHTHDVTTGGVSSDHTHAYSGTTASTGSSGTNANLQPYITVFMWKRTA